MTSVTFETATIADAVRRASRIAPGKAGHAFDKASGLFFEISPSEDAACIIRATNLEAFHTEIIATVAADGDAAKWRLPSQLLGAVVGSLPPKSGAQVKFTQDGTRVVIQQGKMKSTMGLIDPDTYPDWDMFDGSELTMVSALGARVAMVEWAAASDGIPPLCGVYLDGTYAIATDRYKLIRIPCKIDLPRPVLIPSGILGQALKTMGETGVGLSGTQFLLAPDDYTQLRTVIYDAQYVPANLIFATEYEAVVEVDKAEMLDKIGRACNYAGAERNPVLKTFWGKGSIVVMMEDAEVGLFGDVIECPSQLQHDRIEIMFSPKYLTDTLSHAPDPKVKISYDFSHNSTPHVRIDGGSGYFGWVMKRKDSRPTV